MSYKLLGRVERKVHIVRNERSAMVPQKSAYCEAWSSTPGVSLMMRKLRKGTLYRWQVCAMAADSISTARPPGKRCLMVSSSIRLVMNRSPVQTSPLWMRLSIPASFSDKACLNREGQPRKRRGNLVPVRTRYRRRTRRRDTPDVGLPLHPSPSGKHQYHPPHRC